MTVGLQLSVLLGLLDDMREGLQILSPEWRYVYLNEAAAAHGRRTRDSLIGQSMVEMYPGIDTTPVFEVMARCQTARVSAELENEFTYPDGRKAWFELRIHPVPEGILVLSIDITARKSQESQFHAMQRQEAIGRLATGVAHDINNILTAILGFSALLAEQVPDTARPDLDQVVAAAHRAEALIAQMLAFSRRHPVRPRVVDVSDQLRSLDAMLRRLVSPERSFSTTVAPDVGRVRVDPTALEQVLVNLVVNARDATPAGGRIRVVAQGTWLDDRSRIGGRAVATTGPYVQISVADDGAGMSPEVLDRLFEPFFTTKELGRGSGLGLSTCYGIVKQSNGYIEVLSEVGRGTTFDVYLPRVDDPPSAPVRTVTPTPVLGDETVLIIEDDRAIRTVVQRVLSGLGYAVVGVASGEEALAYRGPLDLVLTDLHLPDTDGVTLVTRMLAARPQVRVLLTSGNVDRPEPWAFLAKPFTPDALARAVRSALDAR